MSTRFQTLKCPPSFPHIPTLRAPSPLRLPVAKELAQTGDSCMLTDSRQQLTRNFRSKRLPGPSVDLFRDSFYAVNGLLGRISRAAPKLILAELTPRSHTPQGKKKRPASMPHHNLPVAGSSVVI